MCACRNISDGDQQVLRYCRRWPTCVNFYKSKVYKWNQRFEYGRTDIWSTLISIHPVLMYFVLFPYLNSMREQRFSDLNALRYATKTLYKNLTNNGIKVYFINGLNDRKACGTERCLLNINWQVCLSVVCNWRHLTSWKYEMRLRKSSWCKIKIAVYFEKKLSKSYDFLHSGIQLTVN